MVSCATGTMYKRNSGISAKTKEFCKFNINYKPKSSASKSATAFIRDRYLQGWKEKITQTKKNQLRQEIKHTIDNLTYKKILFLPARFCPSGQLGKPTHIAHICKSHKPAHEPKFAKECNLSTTTGILTVLNKFNNEKSNRYWFRNY
jgi:hypothetical protein